MPGHTAENRAKVWAKLALEEAAPDLLKSLQEMVDAIETGNTPKPNGSIMMDARAALAKARGLE